MKMVYKSAISRLFGRSPFKALHMHVVKVKDAVNLLEPAMKAFCDGNLDEVKRISDTILEFEKTADDIKNDIRHNLPRNLFLPVDRSDLLLFLNEVDNVIDKAEDVAILMTVRKKRYIPDEIKEYLVDLTEKVVETVNALEMTTSRITELLESSFSQKEVDSIFEIIHEVDTKEWESDKIGLELIKEVYENEDLLGMGAYYLIRISDTIGDVADHAEDAADVLRNMIAKQ